MRASTTEGSHTTRVVVPCPRRRRKRSANTCLSLPLCRRSPADTVRNNLRVRDQYGGQQSAYAEYGVKFHCQYPPLRNMRKKDRDGVARWERDCPRGAICPPLGDVPLPPPHQLPLVTLECLQGRQVSIQARKQAVLAVF